MEILGKTIKNLSQDSQSPGQDFNPEPSKYEAGVLTNPPRHSDFRPEIGVVCVWYREFS
jgi:hypothetical protein